MTQNPQCPHEDLNLLHKETLIKNLEVLKRKIISNERSILDSEKTYSELVNTLELQSKLQSTERWLLGLLQAYFPPLIMQPPQNGMKIIPPGN